jgi:uncharacterized membrane protein
MVGFGLQNFYYTGFLKGLELTPEWAPWHAFWAYLDGAILIAGGVSIALQVKARLGAALVAAVYFASVLFLRLPRIGVAMHEVGERTVFFEALTLGCGALFIARAFLPAARIVFGISMIVFGLDHFQVLRFIASLIPAWLPFHMFWSVFTGAAFIAAGVSIITRWQIRWAAVMLGLMFFLWVLLVHAPRVAASPHNADEWNSLLIALAICGASWILAGDE